MQTIITKPVETLKLATKITPIINCSLSQEFINIYATNNANDNTPIWEEITNEILTKEAYYFKNNILTNEKGAVSLKIVYDFSRTIIYNKNYQNEFELLNIRIDDEYMCPLYSECQTLNFTKTINNTYTIDLDLTRGERFSNFNLEVM